METINENISLPSNADSEDNSQSEVIWAHNISEKVESILQVSDGEYHNRGRQHGKFGELQPEMAENRLFEAGAKSVLSKIKCHLSGLKADFTTKKEFWAEKSKELNLEVGFLTKSKDQIQSSKYAWIWLILGILAFLGELPLAILTFQTLLKQGTENPEIPVLFWRVSLVLGPLGLIATASVAKIVYEKFWNLAILGKNVMGFQVNRKSIVFDFAFRFLFIVGIGFLFYLFSISLADFREAKLSPHVVTSKGMQADPIGDARDLQEKQARFFLFYGLLFPLAGGILVAEAAVQIKGEKRRKEIQSILEKKIRRFELLERKTLEYSSLESDATACLGELEKSDTQQAFANRFYLAYQIGYDEALFDTSNLWNNSRLLEKVELSRIQSFKLKSSSK